LYIRVSNGTGYLGLSGSGPLGDAKVSGLASATTVALGGTPFRGFVIAGALSPSLIISPTFNGAPAAATQGWTLEQFRLALLADWFPDPRGGWHVGGSAGLHLSALNNDAAQLSWSGGGFGASAFGGYDFWIGPRWSLGVIGDIGGTPSEKLKSTKGTDTGYQFGAFWVTIGWSLLYH
jgi:hypothetical protein